eukprot:4076859-Lingulodinium_polyedra.AAC.1
MDRSPAAARHMAPRTNRARIPLAGGSGPRYFADCLARTKKQTPPRLGALPETVRTPGAAATPRPSRSGAGWPAAGPENAHPSRRPDPP